MTHLADTDWWRTQTMILNAKILERETNENCGIRNGYRSHISSSHMLEPIMKFRYPQLSTRVNKSPTCAPFQYRCQNRTK